MLKNSLFYSCFWISLQIHNWELPSSVWEGICLQKTERHYSNFLTSAEANTPSRESMLLKLFAESADIT